MMPERPLPDNPSARETRPSAAILPLPPHFQVGHADAEMAATLLESHIRPEDTRHFTRVLRWGLGAFHRIYPSPGEAFTGADPATHINTTLKGISDITDIFFSNSKEYDGLRPAYSLLLERLRSILAYTLDASSLPQEAFERQLSAFEGKLKGLSPVEKQIAAGICLGHGIAEKDSTDLFAHRVITHLKKSLTQDDKLQPGEDEVGDDFLRALLEIDIPPAPESQGAGQET